MSNRNINAIKSNTYYLSVLFLMELFLGGYITTATTISLKNYILFAIMILNLFIMIITHWIYVPLKSKRLEIPKPSDYNPYWDVIEVHVSKASSKTIRTLFSKERDQKPSEFYETCSKTILNAKEHGKDVLFITHHFSKNKLDRLLGDSIEYLKLGAFEKATVTVLSNILRFKSKTKTVYPLVKGYIRVDKIPMETIEFLRRAEMRRKKNK